MGDIVRVIGAETTVAVVPSTEDRTVRVKLGSGPGVTFVGDLTDIHRTFIEVDRLISRLTHREVGLSSPR